MKLKKINCYLLLLVILINVPLSAYAQATSTTPTVTIAAGTGAAVGGAYQGYTSKTAAAATALTLAVLSATGAAVKLTEASVQAGRTVYQVINDKFAQWVGGSSAEEMTPSQAEELQSRFKVITGGGGNSEDPDDDQNNGTNIGEDGKLWFSPGSLSMLKKFCDWLESTDQINDYQANDPSIGEYNTFFGSKYITARSNDYYYQSWTEQNGSDLNVNYAKVKTSSTSNNYKVFMFSNVTFYGKYHFPGTGIYGWGKKSNSGEFYYMYNGDYRMSFSDEELPNLLDISHLGYYGEDGVKLYLRTVVPSSPSSTITDDGIYKGENYDSSILNNPTNQIFVVDPGILNGFNVDSDRQIAIPDYIDLIIQQAEEKAKKDAESNPSPAPQELPVPLLDPITGTKSPANWIDPAPEDAIQDPVESEKRDPDPDDPKDPVIDDDTPTDPEDAIELLKVDLTRIFPFCIPWDLYRLLSKFNADPVTPSITIDWGDILGIFGIDYVATLDLHDYDDVASILRTMETVAFCVGLAVATRSIFLRS